MFRCPPPSFWDRFVFVGTRMREDCKATAGYLFPAVGRAIRDRSIFMGMRDREICNGTTGYFGPLVERGHRLF